MFEWEYGEGDSNVSLLYLGAENADSKVALRLSHVRQYCCTGCLS
jgi:hypothetical protein